MTLDTLLDVQKDVSVCIGIDSTSRHLNGGAEALDPDKSHASQSLFSTLLV